MSKDVVLRRNDTGEKTVLRDVSRLSVPTVDFLPCAFVPDDETSSLAEVTITENGRYMAYSFGAYGIGIAHVNVDLYAPRTVGDITYRIYKDSRGKPHISVSRNII